MRRGNWKISLRYLLGASLWLKLPVQAYLSLNTKGATSAIPSNDQPYFNVCRIETNLFLSLASSCYRDLSSSIKHHLSLSIPKPFEDAHHIRRTPFLLSRDIPTFLNGGLCESTPHESDTRRARWQRSSSKSGLKICSCLAFQMKSFPNGYVMFY